MDLETMLHNQFKSFQDKIETKIENGILGLESELQKMDARLQEIEKQSQEKKQSTHEAEVVENHNLRDNIMELEENLTNNLANIVWNLC
jgi:hypothetical protein